MSRYLIVAHETVTSRPLVERVKQVASDDKGAEFVLLVPATPVRHLLRFRGSEGEAEKVARRRADEARQLFAREGINLVEAKVGEESPLDAVDAEVNANPGYAGFIVSTLPREQSRWLRLDLPGKIQERHGRPVYHVELAATDVPYSLP
jgi:hypothetical protein